MPDPLDSLKALGDQLRTQIGEELDLELLRKKQEPARPLEELLEPSSTHCRASSR